MNINDFIGETASRRIFEIERRVLGRDDDGDRDVKWLLGYISFLKGNRRAKQDGLD